MDSSSPIEATSPSLFPEGSFLGSSSDSAALNRIAVFERSGRRDGREPSHPGTWDGKVGGMSAAAERLRNRISDRTARLGIVRLGYVGLPLPWHSPRMASTWSASTSTRGGATV
jgi:hypothetical protein